MTLSLLFFWEPIRSRFPPYQLMFEGFDRPEDRPFTLVWIFSQFVAGFMVMLPAIWYFGEIGLAGLILIPLLINAVGDGLAEPIGVRWGRHEYRTRALGTDRTYVRTLEGSGFILLTGLVIIALHASQFSGLQFALALAIVPLAMTLAEAFSPHTWDTPFLMAAGYGGLLLVMQLVEPIMAPVRKVIPPLGMIDLSPIVVFIAINLVDGLVVGSLIRAAGISGALVGL